MLLFKRTPTWHLDFHAATFGYSTEVSNTFVYPSKRQLYSIHMKKPNPHVIFQIDNHAYIIFITYADFRYKRVVGKSPVKSPYCSTSVYCCAPNGQRRQLACTNHHWTWEFRTIWLSCYFELAGLCCVNSGFQEKNSKDCCSAWGMVVGHLISINMYKISCTYTQGHIQIPRQYIILHTSMYAF